jgi:serine/threonine-protein kinase
MAVTEFVGTALTLDYASPEQVAGKQISTRSDIYSLGVILYELLCGQRPYRLRRNSKAALEEAVLGQDINLPSTRVTDRHAQSTHLSNRHIAKTLKGDLDAIVLKVLSKAPDDRYATAQALADDLQRWLRKEPVTAQPDRLGYRIRRLVARRWRLIAASSTVAMALVVTASVAMYQAIEATRATKAAQDETRKAQAVTNFLKDLFNTNTLDQVDPGAARKRTAEELLQEGAKRIETALKDAPDQQLELMYLMAEFHDLTKPTELIKRAAEIATAAYGPRHPKTLAAVAKYAHHSPHGGRMENGERALALVEPELPRLINSENVEYRRIAALILDAKLSEYKSKSYQEALGIARQLELLLATLPASEFTKKRHLFLGYVFRDALEFGEAERHLAEAERLRVLEGDFARPAQIVGYALFLSMTGRYREAEVKFLKAHGFERHNDSYQNISGNQFSREIFVEFLCDTSRAAAALALTAAPIRGVGTMERNQKLKPEGSLGSRGLALICFGQIERGLALYSQSDQHMKSKGFNGTGPSDRVYPMLELGRLHDANGYFDEANSGSVDEGLALLTNDRLYFRTRVTLDLAAGNVAGARAALEKSRRILAPPGIGPLQLAQAAWLEASIEQKEQKPDLALLRLEAALDRIAQSPDRLLLREWQAKLEELRGVSLAVLGKPAEAKRSLETALEINKAIFDPKTSIAVGRVALRLAGLHKAAGRASSAKTYQVQADAIRRTHPMFEQWVL